MSLITGIKNDFGSVTLQKSAVMTQIHKMLLLNNSNNFPISLSNAASLWKYLLTFLKIMDFYSITAYI